VKSTKAVKRLAHAEDLISDVLERFSEDAPDIRQQLRDAKAAVGRAKDSVKSQEPARTKSAGKNVARKAAKPARKAPTKQELEG
jgi:hypothetical protein